MLVLLEYQMYLYFARQCVNFRLYHKDCSEKVDLSKAIKSHKKTYLGDEKTI